MMKKSSQKPHRKFSELVPFMLVLGVFCAISVYLLTSFFVTINGEVYEASLIAANRPYTGEPNASGNIFKDVPGTHKNAAAILYFRDIKIITGYEDGTFKPNNEVNRAEYMKVLVKALGADVTGAQYKDCFTDVKSEWFAPYICYAKSEAWVSGYSDGSYRPAQSVNKAEAIKIALLAFEYEIPDTVLDAPFEDTPLGLWFTSYIYVALDNGLLEESNQSQYHPGDPMKRASVVELLYRAMTDKGLIHSTI